jgi:hypothetical protein
MASFGENLRRERELRGVDLREMAEATKISIRFLQALEDDRVDVLPGGLFPRAFVRQYARYLGLDPERLVAEFVYAHGGGEAQPLRGPKSEVRVDQGTPKGVVALGAGLAVLAALGWLWARGRADTPVVPATVTAPPTTFAGDRVYPPPVAGGGSPAAVDGLMVRLDAREESWVEVRADGVVLLSRVMPQGETQRITARREVVLSLGNAGGIAVAVNERPVAPLGAAGEVRRNIVINAQTLPVLQAGASPSPSPRPRTRRSPSPTPSPEESPLELLPAAPSGRPLAPLTPAASPAPSPPPRS